MTVLPLFAQPAIPPPRYGYQEYRLAVREVAASTNERTVIAAVIPRERFAAHTLTLAEGDGPRLLALAVLLNSLVVDYSARQRVNAHVSHYVLESLRLPPYGPRLEPLIDRAARLTCTTPEYDDLAANVGLGSHEDGVTDPEERAQLRAEIDALVAHLYGLTEAEFAHILSTFPLVPEETKVRALLEYRRFRVRTLEEAA